MNLVLRQTQLEAAKALFCRPLRLRLAVWILDRDRTPFFLQEAQDAMRSWGEAESGTRTEVLNFRDHGMLQEVSDGRRNYYHRLDSPYWEAYLAVWQALGPNPQPQL